MESVPVYHTSGTERNYKICYYDHYDPGNEAVHTAIYHDTGGPKNSTKTLVYYIYTQGFQKGNFGYACSIATVFFVIVVAMSLLMKKVTTATD
mgnify:FL=1